MVRHTASIVRMLSRWGCCSRFHPRALSLARAALASSRELSVLVRGCGVLRLVQCFQHAGPHFGGRRDGEGDGQDFFRFIDFSQEFQ